MIGIQSLVPRLKILALTPALSPRRGGTVVRCFETMNDIISSWPRYIPKLKTEGYRYSTALQHRLQFTFKQRPAQVAFQRVRVRRADAIIHPRE